MNVKKFLFVSKDSLSGDIAVQLLREGHSVKFYFEDAKSKDVYDGFLEKVADWKRHLDWADVIVFDDENFGTYADALRKKGKLVVGGSAYTDKLEIDRRFGQAELKKNGIKIVPIWNFNAYDKAIDFIKAHPGRYVYKPSGNGQSGDKRLTLLSQLLCIFAKVLIIKNYYIRPILVFPPVINFFYETIINIFTVFIFKIEFYFMPFFQ